MRTFISLDIPTEIKSEITKIQSDLKEAGVEAKWVKPENTHITIAFLGSINEKQITKVKEILTPMNRFIKKPIKLQLKKLSAFPNIDRARVIFIELSGEIERLNDLAANLRNELKNKNIWFDEKPFVPHITLGRIKKPQDLSLIIQKVKVKQPILFLSKISLKQSQLTSSGPIYTKL